MLLEPAPPKVLLQVQQLEQSVEPGGELEEDEQEAEGGELGTAAGGLQEEGEGQAGQEDWIVVSHVGCRALLAGSCSLADLAEARGCSTNTVVNH